MRTRVLNYYNTETHAPMYSLQVFSEGKWLIPVAEGKACIFDNAEERDVMRAKVRKFKSQGEVQNGK